LIEISSQGIRSNPWQARRVFSETELQSLAKSIAEIGLIQPIVVQLVQNSSEYQLVTGERRLRAHLLLARPTIRAEVIKTSDQEAAMMSLAENIERASLADFEIALAIRNIEQQFSNRSNLAKALGMQRSDLYRYLSFFKLPDFILRDLNQEPQLLGRAAASEIASTIKRIQDRPSVDEALSKVWTNLKARKLDQAKAAEAIMEEIKGQQSFPKARDVQKLYVEGKLVARLVTEPAKLTVEVRTDLLPKGKEAQLRKYFEELLVE